MEKIRTNDSQFTRTERTGHIKKTSQPRVKNLVTCCIGLILMGAAWLFFEYQSDIIRVITPFPEMAAPADATPQKLEALLKTDIHPVIHQYHARNQAAADQAMADMNQCFDNYESGIPDFVKDMTGLGARFNILGRQIGDWFDRVWNDTDSRRVSDYVQISFEHHVYSEYRIRQNIQSVLKACAYSLEANQNQMVSDIRVVVMKADLPVDATRFEMANYTKIMQETYETGFQAMGQQTMINLAESLTGDFLGSWTICQVLPKRYCVPIGLLWSILVEWWADDQLEQKLTLACRDLVQTTRNGVIHDVNTGLKSRLDTQIQELLKANLETSQKLIMGKS